MPQKAKPHALVAGAGFCGLAVCYHLSMQGWRVDLYDPKPIGKGTSGIAAGLLHQFAGEVAKKSPEADQGMQETLQMLKMVEEFLGRSVRTTGGLTRPALTAEQLHDFPKSAEMWPDQVTWDGKALWIREGCAVYTNLYLQGLWGVCKEFGAVFHNTALESTADADLVVWATGADMPGIHRVRGQLLEIEWPENEPPLPLPISSKMYAVMGIDQKSCIVGSTYERDRNDDIPDLDYASREILPKIYSMLPFLTGMPIISCRAGVRASAAGHRPLLKQLTRNSFAIGGMGSKGLLYHALYAKKLMLMISDP